MNIDTKEIFYDKLTYVQIAIPLFNKTEEELETIEDKWFYVMRNLQRFQNRPAALEERIFDKVFKTAELAMFDKKDRMDYEDSLKNYRDIKNVVDTALEEGEKKGEIKGRKQQAIETATVLLLEGFSIEIINKSTNLSTRAELIIPYFTKKVFQKSVFSFSAFSVTLCLKCISYYFRYV